MRMDRERWLEGAQSQARGLGRLAEGVVQLELSREGRLWAHSLDGAVGAEPQAAPDCGALLQQLAGAASELAATQRQVRPQQHTLIRHLPVICILMSTSFSTQILGRLIKALPI